MIQTSTDGTNFTEAADVTITGPGLKTTTFAARTPATSAYTASPARPSTASPSGTHVYYGT